MLGKQHPIGYTTDLSSRPKCSVPGCNKLATNYSKKKGQYLWRRAAWIAERYEGVDSIWCCSFHHREEIARRHGVKSAAHLTAKRNGFDDPTEYKNSKHPYLRYRGSECDNKDGRLGFHCGSDGKVAWKGMLDVDHIDGDHFNNDPNNLHTLCKCCHAWKSVIYGDNVAWEDKTPEQQKKVRELIDFVYRSRYASSTTKILDSTSLTCTDA